MWCCRLQLKSDAKEPFEKFDCSSVVKNVRNCSVLNATWLVIPCYNSVVGPFCPALLNNCIDADVHKAKGSPYSIAERRVLELIPVLGSQPAGDVSHKPSSRLPLFSARPADTLAMLKRAAIAKLVYQFRCLVNRGTMGVNSLPKTVNRQRRDCNLNPGPSAPESSTLTTRLPSTLMMCIYCCIIGQMKWWWWWW